MIKKILLYLTLISICYSNEINFDNLIKKHEEKLQTNKIIVSILDNKTKKIVYEYNKDLAEKYIFEPGSIFKPITMAILLDNNLVKKDEQIYLYNNGEKDKNGKFPMGIYKIDRFTFKDVKTFSKNYFNYKEILKNSSNIGMLQLAQRISEKQYKEGFSKYGLHSSNLDNLSFKRFQYEKDNLLKATCSWGQGFNTTFNELFNAYSILNTNDEIKNILSIKKENKKIAKYKSTSQIVENNIYVKKYISSTFGFISTKDNSYTIGITAIEPLSTGKYWYYYFANYSSEPLFDEIVNNLN